MAQCVWECVLFVIPPQREVCLRSVDRMGPAKENQRSRPRSRRMAPSPSEGQQVGTGTAASSAIGIFLRYGSMPTGPSCGGGR